MDERQAREPDCLAARPRIDNHAPVVRGARLVDEPNAGVVPEQLGEEPKQRRRVVVPAEHDDGRDVREEEQRPDPPVHVLVRRPDALEEIACVQNEVRPLVARQIQDLREHLVMILGPRRVVRRPPEVPVRDMQ